MRIGRAKYALLLSCTSISFALSAVPLEAATGNVVFNGNVTPNNYCSIAIQQTGTLGISANVRQMSSKIAGGISGKANVLALGNYNLSAVTPSIFAVGPLGADTSVTRQVLYSGTNLLGGGATFAEKNGSLTTPITGISYTAVNMNFVADRTGSTFPSGHYEALVVLRCE
jgi:hypothetical protein